MATGKNVFGAVASTGFNLIEDASDSGGWMSSDQIGTSCSPIDPLLQTFTHDNGGSNRAARPSITATVLA